MNRKWIVVSTVALMLGPVGLVSASARPLPGTALSPAMAQDHDDHDRGGWDAPPGEYRDVQRKGFHDGLEGARKDFENHRRPNVENRDEYRHPDVSHEDRRAYRDAFRRGYEAGVSHWMNGGPR
jgi:hypothetical protein